MYDTTANLACSLYSTIERIGDLFQIRKSTAGRLIWLVVLLMVSTISISSVRGEFEWPHLPTDNEIKQAAECMRQYVDQYYPDDEVSYSIEKLHQDPSPGGTSARANMVLAVFTCTGERSDNSKWTKYYRFSLEYWGASAPTEDECSKKSGGWIFHAPPTAMEIDSPDQELSKWRSMGWLPGLKQYSDTTTTPPPETPTTELPDRVNIKIVSTGVEGVQILVTGTVASKSKITSSVFYRIEPGNAKQGYLSISGDSFNAECEFVHNQTNIFKIVIDNEAKLSCETTLTFSGDGTLIGVQTTSPKGEVTEPVPVPKPPQSQGAVPGLGGVGNIPGPSSLTQGIIGVIIPALISILVNVFSGFGGGTGMGPPTPPMRPAPPSTLKAPPKPPPPKPSSRPPTDPTTQARKKLDNLGKLAKKWNNKDLEDLVNKARKEAFGPDGKFDPNRWETLNKEMINAVNKEIGKDQLGVVGQVGVFGKGAIGDTVDGVKVIAGGAKDFVVGAYKGGKDIIDAILHPGYFRKGLDEATRDYMNKNLSAEREKFQEALKGGHYLDALKEFGKAMGKVSGDLLGSVASGLWQITKGILPIDEFKTLNDPNASERDKCLAVSKAAIKIALILAPTKFAKTRVPGLDKVPTSLETRAGAAVANQELLNATRTTQKVEKLVPDVLKGRKPMNFKEAQKIISENPKLRDAIDNAIKAGGKEGKHLYDQRLTGEMSKDAHTLITARKIQVQEEIANSASKRIIQEDVKARLAAGEKPPSTYRTMNATEGSRTNIRGANDAVDYDQTIIGNKYVTKDRVNEILQEECAKRSLKQEVIDINIYTPKKGLSDATGATPNSEIWLQKGQQKITAQSGLHQVHVTKDGEIIVSDHFKGKGSNVLGIGEEVDTPITIPGSQAANSMNTQLENVMHAYEKNNINQMAKYAARGIKLGHNINPASKDLIFNVASSKDPYEAMEILKNAGIHNRDQLLEILNIPKGHH